MQTIINSKEVSIEEAIKYLEGSEKVKLPLAKFFLWRKLRRSAISSSS